MKKVLNVIDRIGNLEEVGKGTWQSGFWYRPGRNFDVIRVFHEKDGRSVRGGIVKGTAPHGERTIILFEDDASEQGRAAPRRFGQNGCATTFESAEITTEDRQRLQTAASILAAGIYEVKQYIEKYPIKVEDWKDGIGGYANIFSRNKINLKLWLDRTQFEGEALLYAAFDSSSIYDLENFTKKYFGSHFETLQGGYAGGDYEWDDESARLHLREPIDEARAARPRWETFFAEQGDEYYFGLNQFIEESDASFLGRASVLLGGAISAEWQKINLNEMLQKAEDWDENVKTLDAMERRRLEIARNPYLVEVVLLDANGRCQNCGGNAPFKNAKNRPYLEVHHIKSLSRGGADTLDNMAAICPNCHRQAHFGKDADVVNENLRQLAAKRSF